MRFSIESRVPFLTPQLAEFIMSLPERFIVNDLGERKAVFRSAMRGAVPDAILNRRDKIGFQTSESQWLKALAPWVRQKLQSEVARGIPALRIPAAMTEFEDFVAGRRPISASTWRWINLVEWTEQFDVEYDA